MASVGDVDREGEGVFLTRRRTGPMTSPTHRMGLVKVKVAAFKDLKQKKTLAIYFLAGSFSVSTEFTYFIDIHEAHRKPKSFF